MKLLTLALAALLLSVLPQAKAPETKLTWFGHAAFVKDMETIGEMYRIDVALVNIGGHFGMERRMAARAAQAVRARMAIPQHFGTFPGITETADGFVAELRKLKIGSYVMKPGETKAFR